jgi:hypothetical protein
MKNNSNACSTCRKPNATLNCGLCQCQICKKCKQTYDVDTFFYLPKIPQDLTHNFYCWTCFDEKINPEIESYNEKLIQAKNLVTFSILQKKETRLMSRNEKPIYVENCKDREEALLRLAFLAVISNFNSLIDVDIISKKIVNAGYQKLNWSGSAIPINLEQKILDRRFF